MPDIVNVKMQFQISLANDFSTLLYEYDGDYVNSINTLDKNITIPKGVSFYAKVRYYTDELGYSDWSHCTLPYVIAPSENILGICMVSTGGGVGEFKVIGWDGNYINNFDYTTHPLYLQLSQVTIDGNIMMEIPTLYINTSTSGPQGSDSEGKKCWWLTNTNIPGFRPAAAFKRDGVIKEKIWWGTYLASSENVRGKVCLASKYNKTVVANKTLSTFETYADNRNSGGYTGFRLFDIWDISLLKMLLLIFGQGSDVQSIWGDNTSHSSYLKTGKVGSKALYMCDLWATYQCNIPGISYDPSTEYLQFINPLNETTITTNYNTAGRGWISDICDGVFTIGNDNHNLMELFIPKTTTGSQSDATFPDYCVLYQYVAYPWLSGGRWDDWYNAGLFAWDNSYWDGMGYSNITARLAKS